MSVYQEMVINKILSTKDYSIISRNNLTDKFFYDQKAEFNYIVNHYNKYKIVPDILTFLSVFNNFTIVDVNEPVNFLLENLFKEYNSHYIGIQFNKVKELIEAGETEKAIKVYQDGVERVQVNTAMTYTDILSDKSRYDRYKERCTNKDKQPISTGFPEIDALIGGIDRENENMVIMARTGLGKTWTLLKMATAASRQGLCVGIYSGEMVTDKVAYRVDTLLGGMRNSSISRNDATYDAIYYDYLFKKLPIMNCGPINVITPADIGEQASVSKLRQFMETANIDILFIDQYSLLEDENGAKTETEQLRNISKAVKNLQVLTKKPIISVTQMNRQKNENGLIDATQIYGSDRIGQDATCILSLERKDDKLIIHTTKARDGGDNKDLTYHIDLNTGIFEFIPDEDNGISTPEDIEALENSFATDEENPF